MNEVDAFCSFLKERGFSPNLVAIECAWVAQLPPGAALRIIELVKKVDGWLDERREK